MSANKRNNSRTLCAGQFVSRSFVIFLRKTNPQNHNLQTAVVRGFNLRAYGEINWIKLGLKLQTMS